MFTGIVAAIGRVKNMQQSGGDWKLGIETENLDLADVSLGDSIAVNGCCLTVVEIGSHHFLADVSAETVRCTTLGNLVAGSDVNLEKAMLASDRFGGHIVSGHIDGVGTLVSEAAEGDSLKLEFQSPMELARYIAPKGSICIDGTSLTVNSVQDNKFMINVIPHTQKETIIGSYETGQRVNLEVDLIARYLERLHNADNASAINLQFLRENGYTSPGQD